MDPLIDTATADRIIADSLPLFATERVHLADAPGRVLRQPVLAEMAQPPFDRVMMDGIAVASGASRLFRIAGAQMAGSTGAVLPDAGSCIEVTTGAVLPDGCDCVIPVEQLRREGDRYALADGHAPARNQFIHRRGIDCAQGAVVLEPGVRIGGPEMSQLAANGVAELEVSRSPRIAIIATGDELVPVDAPLLPGQIRRSNDLALAGALRRHGFDRIALHHVADSEAALRGTLGAALEESDVLILSGGVSMGQRDYVPGVLAALGVAKRFHGIAQRPGKPMWFGVGAGQQAVFALPGNPVSSLVCMTRYVRPALLRASGLMPSPRYARIAGDTGRALRFARFLPTAISHDPDGVTRAHARGWSNSGDFTQMGGTHGFVELLPDRDAEQDQPVPLFRW